MSEKDNNVSKTFGFYKDNESTLKKRNIEKDYKNLVDKSLNDKSYVKDCLSKCTLQNKFFANKLS